MNLIRIKKVLDGTGNTVHLAECSDSEQTYTDSKKGKNLCKPFPFRPHSLFNIVERATQTVSVFVNYTIFDGK